MELHKLNDGKHKYYIIHQEKTKLALGLKIIWTTHYIIKKW